MPWKIEIHSPIAVRVFTKVLEMRSSSPHKLSSQHWGPHLWFISSQLGGLLSLVMVLLLKEEVAAGKEREDLELGRRISSNCDFQLPQPLKPQGGLKAWQYKPGWWLKHTMYSRPVNKWEIYQRNRCLSVLFWDPPLVFCQEKGFAVLYQHRDTREEPACFWSGPFFFFSIFSSLFFFFFWLIIEWSRCFCVV